MSLAFSQRRKKGFRNFTELDHRRVLVSDSSQIKVYGYSHELALSNNESHEHKMDPMLIISHDINKSKQSFVFEESIDHSNDEEILFTHFMSDYDPSLILILTFN